MKNGASFIKESGKKSCQRGLSYLTFDKGGKMIFKWILFIGIIIVLSIPGFFMFYKMIGKSGAFICVGVIDFLMIVGAIFTFVNLNM